MTDGLILAAILPAINGHDMIKRVYSPDGLGPTVTSKTGGGHEPKILVGSDNNGQNGQ